MPAPLHQGQSEDRMGLCHLLPACVVPQAQSIRHHLQGVDMLLVVLCPLGFRHLAQAKLAQPTREARRAQTLSA